MICLLHRAARADQNVWANLPDFLNAGCQLFECSSHAPDRVMKYRRSIQRNDHVVDVSCDQCSVLLQEKSRRKQRNSNSLSTEHLRECEQLSIQLRLAAGKYDPADP